MSDTAGLIRATGGLPGSKRAALQERMDIIASMNPELKKTFSRIIERVGEQAENGLRFYYWLGQEITRIYTDQNVYGEGAVDKIANAMQIDKSLVYKARVFAESYTDAEFEELCNLRMESADGVPGSPLGWSHVIQLLSVEDKKQRVKLQNQTAENGLTSQDLAALIKTHFGGSRGGGGRPLSRPKTVRACLTQIRSVSTQWLKRQEQVWAAEDDSVFAAIDSTPPDDITTEMQEELSTLVAIQEKMEQAAHHNAVEARRLLGKVSTILGKREPEPASTKSTGTAAKKTAGKAGGRTTATAAAKKSGGRKKAAKTAVKTASKAARRKAKRPAAAG